MVKTNLPVIILRGGVLLPYCEFRLDLTTDIDKHILDLSLKNHDSHILLISPSNPLEESIDVDSLPKIGTVAKIKMKMQIGRNTRLVLEGLNRVNIIEYKKYSDEDDVLDALITSTTQFAMSPVDEKITGEDVIQTKGEQLENLEERYKKTEGYIEHNKNEMNKEDLKNIENKQENRKNQIENLKD